MYVRYTDYTLQNMCKYIDTSNDKYMYTQAHIYTSASNSFIGKVLTNLFNPGHRLRKVYFVISDLPGEDAL